jgi:hypothetical protein
MEINRRNRMATIPEEIVSATELQRDMKRVLQEAEQRPIYVRRPGGIVITMVDRNSWVHAQQAQDWLARTANVMLYILMRARNLPAEPPTDFAWLKLFTLEDLREFTEELGTALQSASAGLRPFSDVDAVLKEWHRSAVALADEQLQQRLNHARDDLSK